MRHRWILAALASSIFAACSSEPSSPQTSPTPLTKDALMDPDTCAGCHSSHFQEWSGSMHAYASDDPVFVAMNARAQRETQGKIGTFCVQCHAPLAFRTGATRDGLNLGTLPAYLRGVTCYFCHSVDGVDGTHNDALRFETDGKLRGPIANPVSGAPHPAVYSPLFDRDRIESSSFCGSCHDVTTPSGVDLERTFAEWQGSLFAHTSPTQQLTCTACHMPGSDGQAAEVQGAPVRRVHDHSMVGVDVALRDFPQSSAQRAGIQANLDPALVAKLCVKPPQSGATVDVTLDNAFVGHAWPSGAIHDRRAWIELVGYASGQVVFQSGVVQDGQAITAVSDPNLWLMRGRMLDSTGGEVPMMWQAARVEASQLPPAVTNDPQDPAYYHAVTRSYDVPPSADRITLRVRIMPLGLDVIDELIQTGDLDPSFRTKVPTFTLAGATLEWTQSRGFTCVP